MAPSPTGVVNLAKGNTACTDDSLLVRKRHASQGDSSSKKLKTQANESPKNVFEFYHPGELEVDDESSTWDDWDHGPRDTKQCRRDYPEGFYWTCCEEPGTAKGCTKGDKKSPENLSNDLKVRYADSEPYSDGEGHPGELEIDYDQSDTWDNWDFDNFEADTNTNRRLMPEAFVWSCCGRPGGSAGCQKDNQHDEYSDKED